MSRISYWYTGLSRKGRIAVTAGGIALAVIVAVIILYLAFKPNMVEVRYGEIIWDPIDGHVWEDNTQTKMVESSEAGDYRVTYIEKLSPEHEEQLKQEQERLAEEQQQLEGSSGVESITVAVPSDIINDLQTLQQNIQVSGQDVVTGLETAKLISDTRAFLIEQHSIISSTETAPQAEQYKQAWLTLLNMGIQVCDYYLQGIETGDLNYITQANDLLQQAAEYAQNLIPTY